MFIALMIGAGGIKGAAECARAFLRGEHIIGDVRVRLHCRRRGFGGSRRPSINVRYEGAEQTLMSAIS